VSSCGRDHVQHPNATSAHDFLVEAKITGRSSRLCLLQTTGYPVSWRAVPARLSAARQPPARSARKHSAPVQWLPSRAASPYPVGLGITVQPNPDSPEARAPSKIRSGHVAGVHVPAYHARPHRAVARGYYRSPAAQPGFAAPLGGPTCGPGATRSKAEKESAARNRASTDPRSAGSGAGYAVSRRSGGRISNLARRNKPPRVLPGSGCRAAGRSEGSSSVDVCTHLAAPTEPAAASEGVGTPGLSGTAAPQGHTASDCSGASEEGNSASDDRADQDVVTLYGRHGTAHDGSWAAAPFHSLLVFLHPRSIQDAEVPVSSLSFDSGEIHHTISTRPPHIGALLSLPGTPVMRTERHDDKDDSATTRRPDRQTHHAK
jgi:hypothetical protein